MRTLAATLLLVLTLCACSGDEGEDGGDTRRAGDPPPTTAPDDVPGAFEDTEACAEVRAGIDAYNLGDVEETVARFEAAVPLGEELAAGDPSAEPLLEAIRYYAALPAAQYEAASPSPEFQRHKTVTLTQCAYGAGPAPSETPRPA